MTNNPFKMWGSYIGAVLYPIISLYTLLEIFSLPAKIVSFFIEKIGLLQNVDGLTVLMISMAIAGFLIGWGVQVLWRKYK